MLADENPGDGGAAVVQGSHKANLQTPRNISTAKYASMVNEVSPTSLYLKYYSCRTQMQGPHTAAIASPCSIRMW
jgi:hypothetical protein